MKNILGLYKEELEQELVQLGEKKFRAGQIWRWVYITGVNKFDQMTDLPKALIERLKTIYSLERVAVSRELISFDETRKWLLKLADNNEIEAVFIPESHRGTLCVSSQVGCTLTCKFCHTGTQTLVRNLEAHEIVGQFMHAKDCLDDWPSINQSRRLTNIVMMGMGEPLYNVENVIRALKIIMHKDGLNLSKRKITLSTSGVVPEIERVGKELNVNLAISLHAVNDELRNKIVPLNKKYPIAQLLQACKLYAQASQDRRITFEYVMLNGVNDSDADARELVRLIKGIPAKVNLIPFNPWPNSGFDCSTPERIKSFSQIVERAGYKSPVRTPRGQDIMAACGQLKSESLRIRKSNP